MEAVRPLLSVILVFALLGGLLWLVRKGDGLRSGPRLMRRWRRDAEQGKPLQTLGRVALTPHHSLHLVRFGDRLLLVGTHAGGCRVLDRLPAEKPAAASRRAARGATA